MDNRILLNVVVNGKSVPVEENVHEPLHTLMTHALNDSGNSGQSLENWELRDAGGSILDSNRKISDLNIAPGTNLFLNLKAGIGGAFGERAIR